MSGIKGVNKKVGVLLLSLTMLFGVLAFVIAGGSASVWTDKEDYQKGEIVLISGEDFLISADLSINITRPDDVVETCDINTCNERFLDGPLSSDEFGGFEDYQYDLDGIEGFYLVEVWDDEHYAQTTFTDTKVWVITPNGEEVWSGINDIEWSYILNPYVGPFDYELYYNEDSCEGAIEDWNYIVGVSCSTKVCSYPWDTTDADDGDYCVGVVKTSGLYRTDTSDDLFEISNGFCGDGIKNGDEECDGDDWGDVEECSDVGEYNYGDLSCTDECIFDVSECALDELCPAVNVINPPASDPPTWYSGTVVARAAVTDFQSGVATARVIFLDSGAEWRDPPTGLGFEMTQNPNTDLWEYEWDSATAEIPGDCSITHAQVFGEDNAGNGANNQCSANNVFGVDNSPPVTTKEIGEPSHDGGYYVTTETSIALTATDCGSGVEFIHYEVWWDSDDNGVVDTQLVDENVFDVEVTFNFDRESLHELRWYAVDLLGNVEEEHVQEHAVDETEPEVTKTVGEPSILVDENCNPDEEICDYYVTQNTEIALECVDPEPHPANDVGLYWRTYLVGDEAPEYNLAEDGFVEIQFDEDSEHLVDFYCEDALGNSAGSAEDPFQELDIVESQPPIISKELIGHSVEFECPESGQEYNFGCYYITQETLINITAYDPEPHPVNDVEIFCEYWLNDEHFDLGLIEEPFSFPEDSEHELHCWAVDALGNTADLWELDRVDTQPPMTEKTIEGPIYPEDCIEDGECWITQNSIVELVCEDQEPHPVGDVTLYYRTWLDGNVSQDWTPTDGDVEIQFDEDSEHMIEWYCNDALWNSDGTEEDPYSEIDNVDTEGPLINKSVSDDLVMPGDVVEICADVVDIKQTGDEGVGVNPETVDAILSKGDIEEVVDLEWVEEDTYCGEWEVPEITEECAEEHCLWDVEVEAEDWLENYNIEDGIHILVDDADPEMQQILNPYPGRYYRDGKQFAVVAQVIDQGGSPEVEGSGALCEASGVAECEFYAFDYPYEEFEKAEVRGYWDWLVGEYGEEGVFDQIVFLGSVPEEDGVCQGIVGIPEDSGLEDKAFLVHRVVDEAGNWEGDISENFNDDLILLDMDNEGPGVIITDMGNLPGPLTEGDSVVGLTAEIVDPESGFVGCYADLFVDNGEELIDTGHDLDGNNIGDDVCEINDIIPFGLDSGDYELRVNAVDDVGNVGYDWAMLLLDNDRPTMSVVAPLEGEVYGVLMPVSLNLDDVHSPIADETVQFRLSELPTPGNLFCIFGTCEDTGWVGLPQQENGLYADLIDLSEHGITGEGRYVFDSVACDDLYDPDEDVDMGFVWNSRNQMHCRGISEQGGVDEEIRPACNDGWDNDLDGFIDYPDDEGCDSAEDDDETGDPPAEEVVVINEFVSDSIGEESEWIELYNPGDSEINLTGWTVEDGTTSPFDLSGFSISSEGYLLLIQGEDHSFVLNDIGDIIILKDSSGEEDKVAYGTWDDGNVSDNALAPGEGESAGRFPNGVDTNIDLDDFVVFESPTPDAENVI
jgi:hypothetical protein